MEIVAEYAHTNMMTYERYVSANNKVIKGLHKLQAMKPAPECPNTKLNREFKGNTCDTWSHKKRKTNASPTISDNTLKSA